jgi:AraC family transcriptional regulator
MDLLPQQALARQVAPVEFCGVQWGLLGRVASERGVEILATHGMPNDRIVNQITTVTAVLAYSLQMPGDAALRQRGQPFRSVGPINFYSRGASFALRGSGPMTISLCFLGPAFLAGLSEIESGIRIGDLDIITNIESDRLTYLGRTMFREAIEPGFASSLFAESVGLALALEIARLDGVRRLDDKHRRGGLAPWQMRRLESHVRENLSSHLTLAGLAQLLGMSVRHLSRAVKQDKGVSVYHWIAECRMSEARRLLTQTNLPVHEIGRRCAFQNAAAFSTAFRAASGFTPGEFRRLNLL